jgi:hypothetical protein
LLEQNPPAQLMKGCKGVNTTFPFAQQLGRFARMINEEKALGREVLRSNVKKFEKYSKYRIYMTLPDGPPAGA